MLKIEHLTKVYGDKKAVDDVSLHIQKGEIFGFIGHNGAGKTTTLKAICVLNLSGKEAHIDITIFFENDEPMRGIHAVCKHERTNHIRLDKIVTDDGRKIPKDLPYAVLVESDQPIVVQASRLDVSQPEYALMTTIAY